MKVAQLVIEMAASMARLEKDMAYARRTVDGAMNKIRQSAQMAMRALGALGLGLSVNALNNFVRGAINAGDEMSKLAQRVGISTDSVAGLQLAFTQGGSTAQEMQASIARLSRGLTEGNDGIKRLGITSTDTIGALQQIADQFQAMPDGLQKTALAVQIFGRSGANLIPILNQGAKGLSDYDDLARKLGITVDTETGRAFEKFNDTLDTLSQSTAGIANALASELVPRLQAAADTLLEFMMSLDIKKIAQTTIDILTVLSILVAGRVVAGFAALGKMLITTTGSMTAMNVAAGVLRGTLALLGGPVGAIAAAAGLLYTFRTELGLTSDTAYSSRDALIALKDSVNELSVAQTQLKITEVWNELLEAEKAVKKYSFELQRVNNQIEAQQQLVGTMAEASFSSYEKLIDKTIELASGIESATERSELLRETLQTLGLRASGAAPKIKQAADAIQNTGKAAKDTVGEMRKLIEQYKFETEMLTKSEAEKEYAIFLRKLETDGVKEGTAAYKELTEAKIAAMQDRQFTQAVIRQAEEQKKSYDKQINDRLKLEEEYSREVEQIQNQIGQSLTDALMNGGMKARDFLINMFKTLVLRPILQPIITGITGGIMSAIGFSASAGEMGGGLGGAMGLSSIANSFSNAVNLVTGGFQALGATVSDFAVEAGFKLISSGMQDAGVALLESAGAIGTASSYLAGIGAGIGLGQTISGQFSVGGSSMVATGIGTALGAALGGPLGAAIGGALGGVVNRAFGMGGTTTENAGYLVSLQAMGAEVQAFEDWKRKGGWFRSDQTGRNITEAAQEVNEFFSGAAFAIGSSVQAMAQAVGISTNRIGEFAQDVIISTKGFTEEEFAKQVEGYLMGLETSLVDFLVPAIWEFGTAADKTAADVLKRLTSSLMTVNQAFEVLGYSLYEMSLQGGAAASKLVDLFGGLERFTASTTFYYENFYSAQEKVNFQTEQLTKIFGSMNAALPATRDEFRALVEMAQAAGNDTAFANLLQLAPAFNALHVAMEQLGTGVEEVIDIVIDNTKELERITTERYSLETQLLQLQNDTILLRQRELETIDESNRALQLKIWAIEDEVAAYQEALRVYEEARNLELQFLQLVGDTAEIRRRELDALNPLNRGLQEMIYRLQDAQTALQGFISSTLTALGKQISDSASAANQARQTAQAYRDAGQSLREAADAIFFSTQTGGGTRGAFASMLASARGGDVQSMQALPQLGQQLQNLERTQSASSVDFAIRSARIANELTAVAAVADVLGLGADYQALLLDVNTGILEVIRETLQSGNATVESLQEQTVALNQISGLLVDSKDLSVDQIAKLVNLETVGEQQRSLTELVTRATAGNEALTESVLQVLGSSTRIVGIDQLLAGNTSMIGYLAQIQELLRNQATAAGTPLPTTPAPTQPTASMTARQQEIISEFDLVLKRAPTAAELSQYDKSGLDRFQIRDQLRQSDMYRTRMINEWYNNFLQRGPSPDRMAYWMSSQPPGSGGTANIYRAMLDLHQQGRLYKDGGFYPGGMAMVGEEGPELINFSRPGQVYTASETQNIMRGSSDSSSEIRQLREENRIQTRTMVALQNRMTKLMERWDNDGLPSERYEGAVS
jgi:hypothetical protein